MNKRFVVEHSQQWLPSPGLKEAPVLDLMSPEVRSDLTTSVVVVRLGTNAVAQLPCEFIEGQ